MTNRRVESQSRLRIFFIDTILTINFSTEFINENFGPNRFEIASPERFSLVYRHLISKLYIVLHNDIQFDIYFEGHIFEKW